MVTKLPHHHDCTKKAGQLTPGCCCVWARETQAVPSAVKQPTGSSAVVVGWASVMYCQASGERIQTMGMKLRFTGHSSQWGRSLPQDRQKSNTMGHKQIMRFLQCPGRFSDVYVGWTDDGRCWTEVGLDEWATGEGNLVHIELAFWHFIANCQQALCIYYRKQHIPTE